MCFLASGWTTRQGTPTSSASRSRRERPLPAGDRLGGCPRHRRRATREPYLPRTTARGFDNGSAEFGHLRPRRPRRRVPLGTAVRSRSGRAPQAASIDESWVGPTASMSWVWPLTAHGSSEICVRREDGQEHVCQASTDGRATRGGWASIQTGRPDIFRLPSSSTPPARVGRDGAAGTEKAKEPPARECSAGC